MNPPATLTNPVGVGVSQTLLDRYRTVRAATTALTRGLVPEDQVVQSMPDVSPTKWHLAHTTWFWETFLLVPHQPGYDLHHPEYPFLFNSYYVQAGERHCRAQRGYLSRPTVDEVGLYRAHVDQAMEAFLEGAGDRHSPEVLSLVELGLNHEQQHQELMVTDLKHVFSVNPLRPVYREREGEEASDPGTMGWVEVPEGIHEVGWAGPGFAYDNEEPRHRRFLEAVSVADRLVTCGEYLAFMEDGGYRCPELWMSAGWAAAQEGGWTEPFYWEKRNGEWWIFTLAGMRPLDPHEPVCHVNWYEADAYARWAGARLPREEEWEVLAAGVPVEGNLVESRRFHPAGVGKASPERPLRQLFGDVWEWTSSPYSPYPGFRTAPGAVGEYNGKFMVNQFVLRGGSCATPASHLRHTYRNFFPPDASWQFTGIRLARDPEQGPMSERGPQPGSRSDGGSDRGSTRGRGGEGA